MKKKLFNKMLAAALAGTMMLGMVACGNETNTPASNVTETSKESVVASETTATEVVVDEGITYPMQTDVELSIWCANQLMPQSEYESWEASPFHTGLEKNTGVKVEWKYPTKGANVTEAYNLLLLDEKLPNMIFHSIGSAVGAELIEDGIAVDLTEYLPEYAPDYWEYINRPENAAELKAVTTSDGKFFCIPAIKENQFCVTYCGPVIRQDWLDECGLEKPVTLEDWENVLVTFKEKYDATFGCFINDLANAPIGSGTDAFGTHDPKWYIDENGKVQLGQVQPEWKEYMETLARWYEMDLIDKDILTVDRTAMRSKTLNDKIGVSICPTSQLTIWNEDAATEGTGAVWEGIEFPRTAEGEPTNYIHTTATRSTGYNCIVTTSCTEEEIIAALQWLNYAYTEDGIMYWNFGEEGVSYTLDAEGKPQWTELITSDALGLTEALKKYTGVTGAAFTLQLEDFVNIKGDPRGSEAVYMWVENTDVMKYMDPGAPFTDEESKEYWDLWMPIYTHIKEMGLKFIVGDESLDNFEAYVAKLNEMGLQRCTELRQIAYDRYMAQ